VTKREVLELLIEVFDGCRLSLPYPEGANRDYPPDTTVDHDLLMDYLVARSEREAVQETQHD
jgi:hypothetical protein